MSYKYEEWEDYMTTISNHVVLKDDFISSLKLIYEPSLHLLEKQYQRTIILDELKTVLGYIVF